MKNRRDIIFVTGLQRRLWSKDHEKSLIIFSRIIERGNKAWEPSKLYIFTRTKYSRSSCHSDRFFTAFLYTSQLNSCVPRILLRGYRKCAKGDCKQIGNFRKRSGKSIVFTESMHSNFRAFWLVPVSRNLLGYSLSVLPIWGQELERY